jgi:hypothetical protein
MVTQCCWLVCLLQKRSAHFGHNLARPATLFSALSMTGTKQMVLQTPAPFEGSDGPTDTGVLTMTIAKRLMISAVTSLALGVGTAMAQSPAPQQPRQAAPSTSVWSHIQAGASDIEHGPEGHAVPFNGDYGDLANPG